MTSIWQAIEPATVATMLRKKMTPQEVAGALGVTPSIIYRIIKRDGLVYQKSKFARR